MAREGYTSLLDGANVREAQEHCRTSRGVEEPALPEDFLRFRVEAWADNLADAGGRSRRGLEYLVNPPISARPTFRGADKLFSADVPG